MSEYVVTVKLVVEADTLDGAAEAVIDDVKQTYSDWEVRGVARRPVGADPFADPKYRGFGGVDLLAGRES